MAGDGSLDLEEDAFAPEEPVGNEADDDESQGEGDGGGFCRVAVGESVDVEPVP